MVRSLSLFLLCVFSSQSLLPAFQPNPMNKSHVGTFPLSSGYAASWACIPGHEVWGTWGMSCVPVRCATCGGSLKMLRWAWGVFDCEHLSLRFQARWAKEQSRCGWFAGVEPLRGNLHMDPRPCSVGDVSDALAPVLWRKL